MRTKYSNEFDRLFLHQNEIQYRHANYFLGTISHRFSRCQCCFSGHSFRFSVRCWRCYKLFAALQCSLQLPVPYWTVFYSGLHMPCMLEEESKEHFFYRCPFYSNLRSSEPPKPLVYLLDNCSWANWKTTVNFVEFSRGLPTSHVEFRNCRKLF